MKKLEKVDKLLLIIIIALTLFGTLMVLSTSAVIAKSPYKLFIKQLIWTVIGSGCLYAVLHLKQKVIRSLSRYLYIIFIFVLLGVLIWGDEVNNAKRWLEFSFIRFQPSEFMKVIMIIFLADYLDRKKSKLQRFSGYLKLVIILSIPLFLIMLQPDLGSIVVMFVIILSMFFLSNIKLKYVIFTVLLGVIVISFEMVRYPYRRTRLTYYVSNLTNLTSQKSLDVRTQQDAATVALMRGGWFGTGPGQSRLKLFYLPEPHTDFIFAIIGEEWGYLGSLAIIALYILFFIRSIKISNMTENYFSSLLVTGIAIYFSTQAAIHIGVSCGVFPTKGLTLPFISFGGSSLIASMIAAGLLLKISASSNARPL